MVYIIRLITHYLISKLKNLLAFKNLIYFKNYLRGFCFQIVIRSFANNYPIIYYLAAENDTLFKVSLHLC